MAMNNLGIVKRNIARADRAAVDKLSKYGVATIHEAMGRVGLMQPQMRPIYPGAHLCGTAVTVLLHPGDNWMMHVVAEQLQPGDVVATYADTTALEAWAGVKPRVSIEQGIERFAHWYLDYTNSRSDFSAAG